MEVLKLYYFFASHECLEALSNLGTIMEVLKLYYFLASHGCIESLSNLGKCVFESLMTVRKC